MRHDLLLTLYFFLIFLLVLLLGPSYLLSVIELVEIIRDNSNSTKTNA